jgi:hypothetical protein
MYASTRALLSGLVDYAGLFPPAKLPLDQALRNYLRYRAEPESWMLGRIICPAALLGELTAFAEDIAKLSTPLALSVLGRGGADAKEFLDGVRTDLADALKLGERFGGKTAVEAYEVKLPPALCEASAEKQLFALVGTAAFVWDKDWRGVVAPFYEPPSARRETVQRVMDVLARDAAAPEAANRSHCRPAGLKLRCGGSPDSMPTAEELAFAIVRSRDLCVPLKFTAGLHHLFGHFDPPSQRTMHGFLSLFAAGALSYAQTVPQSTIQRIIEDQDFRHFRFTGTALRWNNLSAPGSQVEIARQTLVTSFGSCSFDEPRDDLRGLGLIP